MQPACPPLCSQEYASGHFSQPFPSNQYTSTSINQFFCKKPTSTQAKAVKRASLLKWRTTLQSEENIQRRVWDAECKSPLTCIGNWPPGMKYTTQEGTGKSSLPKLTNTSQHKMEPSQENWRPWFTAPCDLYSWMPAQVWTSGPPVGYKYQNSRVMNWGHFVQITEVKTVQSHPTRRKQIHFRYDFMQERTVTAHDLISSSYILIRQCLSTTRWSTELPNGYLRDRHF